MSANSQLLVNTGRFLDDQLSFGELAAWVQDREEVWATLPTNSVVRILADSIMLAAYELADGVRDEATVKQLVSELTMERASS
jgi:hypothetical protein